MKRIKANPKPSDESSGAAKPTAQKPKVVQKSSSKSITKQRTFGRHEVLSALQGLSRGLEAKGVHDAEIRIFGSVALICAFPDARRLTTDLDAILSSPVFLTVAEEVGSMLKLPEGWLNEDVRTYMRPSLQFLEHRYPGCENIKVLALTPLSLFAMKCAASRDGSDQEDLKYLAGKIGIQTLREAEEIFGRYYRGEAMGELAMVTLLEYCNGRYE